MLKFGGFYDIKRYILLGPIHFIQPHATSCGGYNVFDPSVSQSVSQSVSPVFTCVAKGESRSRSVVTPSVCRSSVRPSQNLVIATPLKLLIQLS